MSEFRRRRWDRYRTVYNEWENDAFWRHTIVGNTPNPSLLVFVVQTSGPAAAQRSGAVGALADLNDERWWRQPVPIRLPPPRLSPGMLPSVRAESVFGCEPTPAPSLRGPESFDSGGSRAPHQTVNLSKRSTPPESATLIRPPQEGVIARGLGPPLFGNGPKKHRLLPDRPRHLRLVQLSR